MDREFRNPNEALCFMVECTMATLERARDVKRTPKSEITRLEAIISSGLGACRRFKLVEAAHDARCPRVERALKEPEVPRGDG